MLDFLAQHEVSSTAETIDRLARTPLSQVMVLVAIVTVLRLAIAPYLANVAPHRRSGLYAVAKVFNEFMDAIVYAGVFVFLVIRPFGVQAFRIPSESMIDTLLVNDFIVANKMIYRYSDPKVGDIVVFRPPTYACRPEQIDTDGTVKIDFIKRCVGVPGDVVEIRNGTLFRNGQEMSEPYLKAKPDWDFKLVDVKNVIQNNPSGQNLWPLAIEGDLVNLPTGRVAEPFVLEDTSVMDRIRELPAATIPPGFYLMMGDNRPGSFDGRGWGLVPREEIIGRAEVIWFPAGRWRSLR